MQQIIEDILAEDLAAVINRYNAKSIFLVTGKSSYTKTGADSFIQEVQNLCGTSFFHFSDFESNPKIVDAKKGALLFRKHQCDMIITTGGGSVIDMGKTINALQGNYHMDHEELVVTNQVADQLCPLIAIPTTAGSGSEATQFAVIYIGKTKYSLSHPDLLPRVVGLNFRFTMSQSGYQAACSGLDALAQAIESYWSVQSTEESVAWSIKALKLLLPNL
ncbi:MAG: iron-containing alcohol dehydrogenase, partial [Flavobacterium sp.]